MSTTATSPLRGAFHLHSRYSFDGSMDHAQIRALLLQHGLRVAGMTEHIENLTPERARESIALCRTHSDEEFLFLPGIEMDHFGVYFLGLGPDTDWTGAHPDTIFKALRQHARLMILAHPVKSAFRYPREILQQCDGIELLNTRHDGPFLPRPRCRALLEELRTLHPHPVALTGLDLHHPRDLRPVEVVLTPGIPLEEHAVLEALAHGACHLLRQGRPLEDYGPLERLALALRQRGMDAAHALHQGLTGCGVRPPTAMKNRLRRLFEGE